MVCDGYVAHAFKPDVCRECGMKKALHSNAPSSSSTPPTASSSIKPVVSAKPALASTTTAAVAPLATPNRSTATTSTTNTTSAVSNGTFKPAASASAAPFNSASSSVSSAPAAVSTARPVVIATPATVMSTTTQTTAVQPSSGAVTSTATKSSKACDTFTAHSFFPNKCRECSQPKADHAIQAAAAPAVAAVPANSSAVSSAALKTTPVKFTSPFKTPTTPPTTSTPSTAASATTSPAVTPAAVASTASVSIKQRLASLGGGFNPLMMNQSPPPATSAAPTPSVDVADLASAINESSTGSPASAVRKPSISVPRRQPSATSLPQFQNGTGQWSPTDPASEMEVRSEEVKAAEDEQQEQQQQQQQEADNGVVVPHTSPDLSSAAPHAHVSVPVVDSAPSASQLFSPASAAMAAEPTVESKASALIGSTKNADMWDEDDNNSLSSASAAPSSSSTSTFTSTSTSTSNASSTSSLPASRTSAQPTTTSARDPASTVSSVSSYLASQRVTTIPVVSSTSSSLFGDDWNDADDDVLPAKQTASKPLPAAPTASVAAVSEKRGLFDDIEKDENDELFREPAVKLATHAAAPLPAIPMPAAASTTAVTQAAQPIPVTAVPAAAPIGTATLVPAVVTATPSSDPLSAASSTSEGTTAPASAADFYAKQAETAAPAAPSLPPGRPAVPPKVASSMFFKPGATAISASTASTSASSSAAASSSSPSSSRPPILNPQKQGVFFKIGSLGFEQKVSDAVNVVPISRGRTTQPIQPVASSANESTTKPHDYVDDAQHKHMSHIVLPPTTASVTPAKPTSNLFDDDDVDDSQLFTHTTTATATAATGTGSAANPHLGIVSRVGSIVRPKTEHTDLFGDADDDNQPPAVQRQHSNVFDNDGFSGF